MKNWMSDKNKITFINERAYSNWHFYVDLKTKDLQLPGLYIVSSSYQVSIETHLEIFFLTDSKVGI